jgi:23S rRNA pseudouridine2457 synthase
MKFVYVIFHKPYGCLSQFTGENGQKTLSNFQLPKNIYTVGRLDKDSEGLLLLTNNGQVQHLLSHPKHEHKKTYWVQVEGDIEEESINQLQKGVVIKGYRTKPCKVKKIMAPVVFPREPPIRERRNIPTSWMEITLVEGKNRQVRRMTANVGYPTLRLIRIQIENLNLGKLEPGSWKFVREDELWSTPSKLKKQEKKKHSIGKKERVVRRKNRLNRSKRK